MAARASRKIAETSASVGSLEPRELVVFRKKIRQNNPLGAFHPIQIDRKARSCWRIKATTARLDRRPLGFRKEQITEEAPEELQGLAPSRSVPGLAPCIKIPLRSTWQPAWTGPFLRPSVERIGLILARRNPGTDKLERKSNKSFMCTRRDRAPPNTTVD